MNGNTERGKLDIRECQTIDWYDGVISALVELGEERAPHLCVVIAWSPSYRVRVYALVPMTGDLVAAIRARLGQEPASAENWSALMELMRQGCEAHVGLVAVFAAATLHESPTTHANVPTTDVPELTLHEDRIERTISVRHLQRWLKRLGVPVPSDPYASARLRFAHFLELGGPGWEARAKQLGVRAVERDTLIEEHSGKLLPIGTKASAIIAILGEPFDSEDTLIRYDLGVRRDYVYEFVLNEETQTVVDSDYVRREARQLQLVLPREPKDAAAIRAEMIRLGVTAKELRAAFGEPVDHIGWWPEESWSYPGLRLELRLGVVEES